MHLDRISRGDYILSNRLKIDASKKTEQDSLLLDPEVQVLLRHMIDRGSYSISPETNAKGIIYPNLATLYPEKTDAEIKGFLDNLVAQGILNSKLQDKVIICPTCSSALVYSKYNCPRCSSFDIGKASIVEHIRCGYIGSIEKFHRTPQMICPKCKGLVAEVDYKKIGTSFECNSCNSRFESPKISHKCNSCEDVFTYREARYDAAFELSLSDETKRNLAAGRIPMGSIAALLKEEGFDVGIKSDLVGKSGVTHVFDIIARKGAQLIVANFTFDPKEEDIIGLFAKKYDIEPTLTLLIALSAPSKAEEAVSKAYGVKILFPSGTVPIGEQIIRLLEEN